LAPQPNTERQSDRSGSRGSGSSNTFERQEVESLVLANRSADRAAKLLAAKILERLAIRRVRRQRFQALKIEKAAVNVLVPDLGNDVDDASGSAAKFREAPVATTGIP